VRGQPAVDQVVQEPADRTDRIPGVVEQLRTTDDAAVPLLHHAHSGILEPGSVILRQARRSFLNHHPVVVQ